MRKLLFLIIVAALAGVAVWQWAWIEEQYTTLMGTDVPKKIAQKNGPAPESAPEQTKMPIASDVKTAIEVKPIELGNATLNTTPNPTGTIPPIAPVQQSTSLYAPALTHATSPFANDINFDPVRIRNCTISPIDEARVAAQEQGILEELKIKEGDMVTAKQVVGKLEDSQPALQKKAAEAEAMAADYKAKSTVNIRFLEKAAQVAEQTYKKSVKANETAKNAVSEVELLEKWLQFEKAKLEKESAEETKKQDALAANAKAVEVDVYQNAIDRRKITSPYDGYVDEITPHLGEWVKAGDIIFRVKKIDTLRVDGLFNVKRNTAVNLYQLPNRAVEIEFEDVKNGQLRRVPGKIINVNLSSDGGDEYRIRAEVANIKDTETNQWVVRPGMQANIVLTPGSK